MSDLIVQKPSGDVSCLILNRPQKRNALNSDLVEHLLDALDQAVESGVRLLVLQGSGDVFCSGFDLSDIAAQTDGDLLLRFVRIEMLLHKVFTAPFVTMAVAQGRLAGAGADLFAACDRRVIVDNAFLSFPGAGFGLVLGTSRLVSRIGADRAREIVRSGREIDASEAIRIGLATSRISGADIDATIAAERAGAARLDPQTVAAVHDVTGDDGSREMAALVRSAARPGLKDRILAYRDRVRGARKS